MTNLEQVQAITAMIDFVKYEIEGRGGFYEQFKANNDKVGMARIEHDNDISRRVIIRLKSRLSKLLFKMYLEVAEVQEVYDDCTSQVNTIENFYHEMSIAKAGL